MAKRAPQPYWARKDSRSLAVLLRDYKVFKLAGSKCQLIILDLSDPIGLLIQKPYRVQKEGAIIAATFCINENLLTKENKRLNIQPVYVVGMYNKKAKSFVHTVDGANLPLVLNNSEITYLVGEERETARNLIARKEENHGE